ncbi:transposase [Neisseria sp. 19428wB4_WF04]|nr:transposase [Neisseria sp. 19428wB4_WF04]TFU40261.1 hypothetical protein E4T99_10230 [Neisseria sp. WF04]
MQSASEVNAGAKRVLKPSFPTSSNEAERFCTEVVPNTSKATLQKVIGGRITVESMTNTDGQRSAEMGFAKHFSVHHGDNGFARGMQHINGIEFFWRYAKHRLARFNGVPEHNLWGLS